MTHLRLGRAAATATARPPLLHPLADEVAALLQVAVGEPLDVGGSTPIDAFTASRSSSPARFGSTPISARCARRGCVAKYTCTCGDLGEEVEVGGERGDGAVEEHHVLHEEHELLRHPGAVAEQLLRRSRWISPISSSADSCVGSIDRAVEAEVADHRLEVGVGRAARRGRAAPPAGRGRRSVVPPMQQAQEGEPLGLVEAAGDAEVEQRGAAVGQHEQVAAVQVAVEDAVDHGALEEADHARRGPRACGVDAGGLHAVDVVEGEARRAAPSPARGG